MAHGANASLTGKVQHKVARSLRESCANTRIDQESGANVPDVGVGRPGLRLQ